MEDILIRNIPAISEDEQFTLKSKSVAVIGCGGLGGYAIEYLARLGIGKITAVDGDVFCESNLNRQLLSNQKTIGQHKADIAIAHIASINPEIEAISINEYLTEETAYNLVKDVDIVFDALDNTESRLVLEDVCEQANVTLIHGAVQGWNLQVAVVGPGSNILHSIYKESKHQDDPASKTCLCPTPACCAAIQISEAIKVLLGRESSLNGQLLMMDLQTMEINIIHMK